MPVKIHRDRIKKNPLVVSENTQKMAKTGTPFAHCDILTNFEYCQLHET